MGPTGIEPAFRRIKSPLQSQRLLQPRMSIFRYGANGKFSFFLESRCALPSSKTSKHFRMGPEGIEPSLNLIKSQVQYQCLLQSRFVNRLTLLYFYFAYAFQDTQAMLRINVRLTHYVSRLPQMDSNHHSKIQSLASCL